MMPSWIGRRRPRAAGEHVADRRRRPRGRRRSSPTGCPAGRGRRRGRRGPLARKTSVSVRTAVVLPVPPFWERTAIFWATRRDSSEAAPRRPGRAERARIPRPEPLRPSPPRACRPEAGLSRPPPGAWRRRPPWPRRLQEVQPVAPDDDLVAVAQHPPLDALAVDEHAVEAAVVEDAHAVGLAHDQRVAARHGRVVEAHVGGQAAPDPRPLAVERRRCGRRRRRAQARYWPGSSRRSRASATQRARAPRPWGHRRPCAGSARPRTARRA